MIFYLHHLEITMGKLQEENCQELEDQKIKSASSLKLLPIGVRAVLVHFCALWIIEKENQQVKEESHLYRFTG